MLVTRIQEWRVAQGLTQAELAAKVGVRRETISHLERGEYNPSLKLAWDIAAALSCGIPDIFDFTEEQ